MHIYYITDACKFVTNKTNIFKHYYDHDDVLIFYIHANLLFADDKDAFYILMPMVIANQHRYVLNFFFFMNWYYILYIWVMTLNDSFIMDVLWLVWVVVVLIIDDCHGQYACEMASDAQNSVCQQTSIRKNTSVSSVLRCTN